MHNALLKQSHRMTRIASGVGLVCMLVFGLQSQAEQPQAQPQPQPQPQPETQPQTQPEHTWIHAPAPEGPISARLELEPGTQLISGLFADHVKVVVRNHSENRAVAVRSLKWWEGGIESMKWHGPIPGSSKLAEKGEIEASLNRTAQSLTSLAFEKGLLLPGEQITVRMPFTPQRYPNNTLQVDYVAVGGDGDNWMDHVLIEGPPPAYMGSTFVRPNDRSIQNRQGKGGLGLLRSTMTLGQEQSPQVLMSHFNVPIPIEKDYDLALTGGLTRMEAAGRAGATIEEMNHMGYYLPKMKTWFFIRGDGDARYLRFEDGKWVFNFMLNMPAFAPELFGRGENKTPILLNPDVFEGIVHVNTPTQGMYYNPGITMLDADELWQVIQHAQKKKGALLDAVVIDPNGLGRHWVLTLAVRVDASGRWEHPKIEPAQSIGDAGLESEPE